MNFINTIRLKFYNYYLKKQLSINSNNHKTVDFVSSKNIGIIFDATDVQTRQIVLDFARMLQNKGKKIKVLGFLSFKTKETDFPFKAFTKSDINWFYIPKNYEVENFMKMDFDILLNLSLKDHSSLNYISALSKAKFRVGPISDNTASYDLMVDVSKNKGLKEYITEVNSYLAKMSPIAGN